MIGDLGAEDFDRLIEAARQVVESARSSPAEPPETRNEAGDQLVRAAAVLTDGGVGIQSLDLDPRAMRLDSHDLAERIRGTVNQALRGLTGPASQQAVPDLDRLAAELHELQDLSVHQLGVFADTINDVLRQLERGSER
ncbi:hypothetical protein [Nonomuraea sediminis]|uniref:hypothetical protein n=1 Tax=Nonomuraea sediminis TaxID=2835864 RepID=UPI001BDBCAF1|nr:hypothetical protein [Nonomuraea sediminis]